jgi:hypothetical protein
MQDNGAGWSSCFAVAACYPSNQSICTGPGSPPTFKDRDTSQADCEGGLSPSCAVYNWTTRIVTTTGLCCGDDAGENTALWSNGAALGSTQTPSDACCTAPNQCYTTAGVPGCFNGSENTPALCTDGFDNDCDGYVDAVDPNCWPRLSGRVVLDPSGANEAGLGALIMATGGYNTTTFSDVVNVAGTMVTYANYTLTFPQGRRIVYASKSGYSVDQFEQSFLPATYYEHNFSLGPRQCNVDCTNDQGFCDSSCIGIGQCQPTAPEIATVNACDPPGAVFGYPAGREVDILVTPTQKLVGVCCKVPGYWQNITKSSVTDNINIKKIDTLVKYTRVVTVNGKSYNLVIATWGP